MRCFTMWLFLVALQLTIESAVEAQPPESVYRLRQWPEIAERGLSGVGRMIRQADRDDWLYGESEHFIAYAASLKDLDAVLSEAEFARAAAIRLLGIKPPPVTAHIFLIEKEETWKKLLRNRGPEREALAMHYRNEIYIKSGPGATARPDRVTHEIVHLLLRHLCKDGLPLWFDEGLACHIGWKVAVEYGRERNVETKRSLPPLGLGRVLPLDKLTSMRNYPQDALELAAYYRQAEELVLALAEAVGEHQLGALAEALCGREGMWRKVLRDRFGISAEALNRIDGTARERCMEPRNGS